MSIEEKARYLLGEAIMRRFLKSERSPDALSEIRVTMRWIATWLHSEELAVVRLGTGILFDDELANELQGDIEPLEEEDDDIPF